MKKYALLLPLLAYCCTSTEKSLDDDATPSKVDDVPASKEEIQNFPIKTNLNFKDGTSFSYYPIIVVGNSGPDEAKYRDRTAEKNTLEIKQAGEANFQELALVNSCSFIFLGREGVKYTQGDYCIPLKASGPFTYRVKNGPIQTANYTISLSEEALKFEDKKQGFQTEEKSTTCLATKDSLEVTIKLKEKAPNARLKEADWIKVNFIVNNPAEGKTVETKAAWGSHFGKPSVMISGPSEKDHLPGFQVYSLTGKGKEACKITLASYAYPVGEVKGSISCDSLYFSELSGEKVDAKQAPLEGSLQFSGNWSCDSF